MDRGIDDLTSKLLLGNVHGLGGTINDISTALKTGSLNAVGNLVGNLIGKNRNGEGPLGGLGNVGNIGSDSTPDDILKDSVYDAINLGQDEDILGTENVHGNFAPDNDNLAKDNVHE